LGALAGLALAFAGAARWDLAVAFFRGFWGAADFAAFFLLGISIALSWLRDPLLCDPRFLDQDCVLR
jgi:hypothetical protein